MTRNLAHACIAAMVLSVATPAPAATRLLDKNSDFAARIDPAVLADGAAFTRSLGGDLAMLANLVTLGAVGVLAFDVLDARGWQSLGIDSSKGIWLSYSVATERDQLHHVRAVIQLTPGSRSAFDNWLLRRIRVDAAWTGRGPGLGPVVGSQDARQLAALRRHKLTFLGRRSDVFVAVRARGDQRIFDITWPFGTQQWQWSDHRQALGSALALPGKGGSLAAHTSASLDAAMTAPIGLWLQAGAIAKLDAARVIAPVRCERLALALPGGPLRELGLALQSPDAGPIRAVWQVSDPDAVARAFAVAQGGKRTTAPSLPGTTVRAQLSLAGSSGLRAVPRPTLFHELGWPGVWRLARQCGIGHRYDLIAIHWLGLAGQWLDDIAATSKTAERIVESFGPIELQLDMLGSRAVPLPVVNLRGWIRTPGADLFAGLLDNLFPHRRTIAGEITAWGRGRIKAYRNGSIVGAMIGDAPSSVLEREQSSLSTGIAPLLAIIRLDELVAIVRNRLSPGMHASLQTASNRVPIATLMLTVEDASVTLELKI